MWLTIKYLQNINLLLDDLIIKLKETYIPEYSFNKVNGHKITNSPVESVNRDIKLILWECIIELRFV